LRGAPPVPDVPVPDPNAFVARLGGYPWLAGLSPWEITARAPQLIERALPSLDGDFRIDAAE